MSEEVQAPDSQIDEKDLCFFCKQKQTDADSAYLVPLSRVINGKLAEGESETESALEKTKIAVPRCASCAQVHQRQHKIRRLSMILVLGVGIGGGLLLNLLLFGFQLTHPGGVLFAIIVAAGGLTYFVIAQRFSNPNQIPGEKSGVSQYQPLNELKEEGWTR